MSWTRLGRWFRRIDVRLALMLLLLASPVLALSLFLAMGYAAHEALEARGQNVAILLDRMVADLANRGGSDLEGPLYELAETEHVAVRLRDGSGRVLASRGPAAWFSETPRDYEKYWEALATGPEDVLVSSRATPAGSLEVAAALEHFTEERFEMFAGLWGSLLAGLLGSAVFALVATKHALAPLREATETIRSVNANQLEARLPVRETGDVVDLHAEALNQALDRLEVGFSRIQAFSADVAHELRTPINRLLNQCGAALVTEAQSEEDANTLVRIQNTVEEMSAIVDGLLLLAQAEEGRLALNIGDVDLSSLLKEIADLYRPTCEEKEIRLEVKVDRQRVRADEGLLVRLISNLLDNAVGLTPPGGRIAIESTLREGGVHVLVSDTGPGIASADRGRIFDRFVRVDASGKRRGSGLGLPIARAIAVAHGGSLRVSATPEGGACFELRLPLGADALPA